MDCASTHQLTKKSNMPYIEPKDAKSPRNSWTLIDVLHPGTAEEDALAVGEWMGVRVLAARWNGNDENPVGNPQSRGLPTWFVLPDRYNAGIIATLPPQKQAIAKALLGLEKA